MGAAMTRPYRLMIAVCWFCGTGVILMCAVEAVRSVMR